MPELPDVTVYVEALRARILGARLERIRLVSPFVLRSVDPPLMTVAGQTVRGLRRLGKRIVIELDGSLFVILHLMIAGRLHWKAAGAKVTGKIGVAAFDFSTGTLVMTEAGTKKRAAIHLARGEAALHEHDPGGLEVMEAGLADFAFALRRESHTLKRVLTDPTVLSGIGNAYSDEILHAAQLSPITQTHKLKPEEWQRLYDATRSTLEFWIKKLRAEAEESFPEGVTAFREGMAVHGRYEEPCPRCGEKILRIRYADKETNYCSHCQTGGKVLADRSLSRLLGSDWPRTLDELEALKRR